MTGQIVTLGQFARLAAAKGWTAPYLAERFRGKVEHPSEFFHRVMDRRYASVALPYRPVLEFYFENMEPAGGTGERTLCACGCGRPLFGRKKLATGYCRVKMSRKRSATGKSGSEKTRETQTFSVINGARTGECLDDNSLGGAARRENGRLNSV